MVLPLRRGYYYDILSKEFNCVPLVLVPLSHRIFVKLLIPACAGF